MGRQGVNVPDQMASPGDARSIAALFMAAGARPDEIDGGVAILIELVNGKPAPRDYYGIAQQVVDALAEYRRREHDVPEEPVVLRNGAPQ